MDFSRYHEVIQDHIKSPGAEYYPDFWWEKEVNLFTADLQTSFLFIHKECTDEEFFWLSEVFEYIAGKSRSAEFIQCIRERATRVENPEWRAEIQQEIEEWAVPAMKCGITTVLMLPPDKNKKRKGK